MDPPMQPQTTLDSFPGLAPGAVENASELYGIIDSLAGAANALAVKISQGSIIDQDSIELIAFELFDSRLADAPLGILFSERFEEPRVQKLESKLAVTICPLQGAGNITSAMPCGSIFSIYRMQDDVARKDISAATLVVAGCFIYGPQTLLILSLGEGVSIFTLDTSTAKFVPGREHVRISLKRPEIAIDMSNYRFWDSHLRHFVDDCISGTDGPLGVDFEIHWNQSLVAAAYRVICRGGLYLYPDDSRPGFDSGKPRLLYEAVPLAFLIEQAGGKASDGYQPIRNRTISQIDSRAPLIFGAAEAVDQMLDYYSNDPTERTRFPLFESRSLLRN
jgi:fructose-1,6-bisphosphatase I